MVGCLKSCFAVIESQSYRRRQSRRAQTCNKGLVAHNPNSIELRSVVRAHGHRTLGPAVFCVLASACVNFWLVVQSGLTDVGAWCGSGRAHLLRLKPPDRPAATCAFPDMPYPRVLVFCPVRSWCGMRPPVADRRLRPHGRFAEFHPANARRRTLRARRDPMGLR